MNEWEFTSDVATWINVILSKDASLPFACAKCEQEGAGSRKRRDFTLLDRNHVIVLTGEVKLPYQKDGGSPHNAIVLRDAYLKARHANAQYFFTWNVNQFVLWETMPSDASWQDQKYRSWPVTNIRMESQLENPITQDEIKHWLPVFLHEFAKILRGTSPIGYKPPDEKFIDALESALHMPILLTIEELDRLYKRGQFKTQLDQWMRDEQGWIIYNDPEGIRDNLERAAKFSCYALVNKLVFYEALLKRYGSKMDRLSVPDHIDRGEELHSHLEGFFAEARLSTGDYETVFGEDHKSLGSRLPFYPDGAVPHWRELVRQIHKFDFSKLDYEIIGSIFERLIAPEERHKYGQFYTRVEVVDLINSFCIRSGEEKVMDPACGGGTFLVRAYARKKALAPARKHGELLTDLYGADISHFASHLTTINLATRDLIDDENYPQIARSDFFSILADRKFVSLPHRMRSRGLGKFQHRDVVIPALDAVVGNPPYVRQEDIRKAKPQDKKNPPHGTKEFYLRLVESEGGVKLSGRSDIHCYFWPHAASFLREDGYLCFLTSSQWMDVEYGFKLQGWILRHFEIVAVMESIGEPWFVGARVATTITILRRQKDEKKRLQNTVRFVQLRRPIAELLTHDGTVIGAIHAVDQLRDEIEGLTENTVNRRYRARLIPQQDLWEHGVHLGQMLNGALDEDEESAGTVEKDTGEYYGGKWGVYLRAPDLWFDLIDRHGEHFTQLGDVADVWFGVKSGKDCFFFPKDISTECLSTQSDPDEFQEQYGIARNLVKSGKVRLVSCGEGRGEIRPIEGDYLEPEVHSLMEIDGFTVSPRDCSRSIVLIDKKKSELKGTYALSYIKWGESRGYHKGSSCASRVTDTREWYDLTGHERGDMFWPMAQQYKHAIPINDHDLICNHNLFDVSPKESEPELLCGILNSTVVVLSKFQYGRPVGVEGNLKTEVIDVKLMLIPDPTNAPKKVAARIVSAFRKLKKRKALQFLSERRMREMAFTQAGKETELAALSDVSELDMPDRRELDDAVFELIGVKNKAQRTKLIDELYHYLRDFFEWTRQKEEQAIANKKVAKRRGQIRPDEMAAQILQEISEKEGGLLRRYAADFLDRSKPYDTLDIPEEGTPKQITDLLTSNGVVFTKGRKEVLIETRHSAQDNLVVLTANNGIRGLVRIPYDAKECERVFHEYDQFLKKRALRLHEMITDVTADVELQEKVFESLEALLPK